jgi:hypothetical protein
VRSYLPLILHFKFIPPTPTATPTPSPSCSEAIVNGGFEDNAAWIFGNTPRPGRYASEEAYLGHRSVLLGIKPPQSDAYSWSSVRQQVTIPADADVAGLSFWYKPFTEEPPALHWQWYDWSDYSVDQDGPGLSPGPLAWNRSDWHEALILDDQFPTPTVLAILMRLRSNSQTWMRQTHDLSAYAGQTINIYFNAYNNGQNGLRTWMYLDEVSLKVCTNVSP